MWLLFPFQASDLLLRQWGPQCQGQAPKASLTINPLTCCHIFFPRYRVKKVQSAAQTEKPHNSFTHTQCVKFKFLFFQTGLSWFKELLWPLCIPGESKPGDPVRYLQCHKGDQKEGITLCCTKFGKTLRLLMSVAKLLSLTMAPDFPWPKAPAFSKGFQIPSTVDTLLPPAHLCLFLR